MGVRADTTPAIDTAPIAAAAPLVAARPIAPVRANDSLTMPEEHRGSTAKDLLSITSPFSVPYYSQFDDITSPAWKKVGCGIASLAMVIDFYRPGVVTVDKLLEQGIAADAYLAHAGWTYAGLISVAQRYGVTGASHDLAGSTTNTAFGVFKKAVEKGPVIASVHYTFDPKNPIPHLVVVRGVKGDRIYYNDPAAHSAGGSISVAQFKGAWKKRYIELWPA